MNELSTKSTNEIKSLRNEIRARRDALETADGFNNAKKVMLGMFDYLQASGYRLPDTDFNQMAGIYADQLREYIALYGYDAIKIAVREFVRNDASTYHQMPTAGQIIEVVKRENGNPEHEYAVRKHDEAVSAMVAREHDELMAGVTPEKLKELEAKYERNRQNKDL